MKKTTVVFILWIFFVASTVFEIMIFPRWFLISMFAFWVFTFYLTVHYENKIRNTPMPVYLANPQ